MLSLKQSLRHRKSVKQFKAMEDDVLLFLMREKLLQGQYGKTFNELSYRLSNVIELTALRFVKDKTEYEMLRTFSPNPDLFHYAHQKGLQTSYYLMYEGKSDEAKERILGKIEVFLRQDISENPLIPAIFHIIEPQMFEILSTRYPEQFTPENESAKRYISYLLKGE